MRLHCLDHGHRFKYRLILGAVKAFTRSELPDVVKLVLYRPELFGRPLGNVVQELMRGPSEWSVGERELLAAFTSKLNHCHF